MGEVVSGLDLLDLRLFHSPSMLPNITEDVVSTTEMQRSLKCTIEARGRREKHILKQERVPLNIVFISSLKCKSLPRVSEQMWFLSQNASTNARVCVHMWPLDGRMQLCFIRVVSPVKYVGVWVL